VSVTLNFWTNFSVDQDGFEAETFHPFLSGRLSDVIVRHAFFVMSHNTVFYQNMYISTSNISNNIPFSSDTEIYFIPPT
jgi:hypothetical protein